MQRTQEDSHEALRCMLDAIKNEEIDVSIYAYLLFLCLTYIIILYLKYEIIRAYDIFQVLTFAVSTLVLHVSEPKSNVVI